MDDIKKDIFIPYKIKGLECDYQLCYQIFIEPKGNQYLGNDGSFKTGKEGWKENFLEEITQKYGFEKVIKAENPNYRLIGLPFFNENHNQNFQTLYKKFYS